MADAQPSTAADEHPPRIVEKGALVQHDAKNYTSNGDEPIDASDNDQLEDVSLDGAYTTRDPDPAVSGVSYEMETTFEDVPLEHAEESHSMNVSVAEYQTLSSVEEKSADVSENVSEYGEPANSRLDQLPHEVSVGTGERPADGHISLEDNDSGSSPAELTQFDEGATAHAPAATTSQPMSPSGRPPPIRIESYKESNGTSGSSSGISRDAAFRSRSDSQSTTATSVTQGSTTRTSLVFVTSALEALAASKDAQKRKDFKDATQNALNEIKAKGEPNLIDPKILFLPLKLATSAQTESVVTTALDCIGKLISYSYFSVPSEAPAEDSESLIDQAIDTICDCFEGEATPDRVQLQIIISLLAAVLNDKVVVHGAGLLKAVRQMYNIFLHSKNTRNQQVAQGTLAQMVATVFERAKTRVAAKEVRMSAGKAGDRDVSGGIDPSDSASALASPALVSPSAENANLATDGPSPEEPVDEPADRPVEKEAGAKMTLQMFERRGSFDEDRLKEGPTMVTRVKDKDLTSSYSAQEEEKAKGQVEVSEEDEEDEVYMKDAFLVFRAMCKISIKSLRQEEIVDLRSQGMRTKLLSLHIIHTVLFNNMTLFLSPVATIKSGTNGEPTPFTQAVKQLLCQALSRNGASSVNRVFEVSCEIFWLMLKHLRVMLKKEVEVFLKEIYLNILDNRNAPSFQKQCLLNLLERLVEDPRALVEIYLNYDCDRTASDNMFQRIVEHLSRLCTTPVTITSMQQHAYQTQQSKKAALADWQLRGTVPPSLISANISPLAEQPYDFPVEYAMKQQALESVVETLRSLVHWAQQGVIATADASNETESKVSSDDTRRDSTDARLSGALHSPYLAGVETPPIGTPLAEDDPAELERARQKKIAMTEAVRQFNFKPKKGIKMLLERGFIRDNTPESIARFLLTNDKLNKAAIGEYLGEGDAENVGIMHAFVDCMDFNKTRFVDALRRFLQSFRLPGEAQKIDRFMLKFAERYIAGNPNAFANADTAYVLAYSVIMLNTDQHSTKMKGRRMTPEDFIKNNRGINDNADLPDEYLRGIFDEIAHNEIVLDTERETAANLGYIQAPTGSFASNLGQAFATVGRDLQREAYMQRSEEMANKTEQLFKSLLRAQRRSSTKTNLTKFIPATSFKHAGPMFDVTWMSFLTALSGCAQDTSNLETVKLCMEGLKLAIQLACSFDLSNPRQAFVQSIARFTNLYNLSEMKAKNVEALRVLLDVAHSEGNSLRESWRDILTCISQLDRFQLISEGVPERSIPDVFKAHPTLSRSSTARSGVSSRSLQVPQRSRLNSTAVPTSYRAEIAEESKSSGIVHGVDRIFSGTSKLNGDAIVHFVNALTQVSWQEIESSGQSSEPRTYSLQKLVEVSEYNMTRVRFEWTNIWQVLGDYFNQVGCHTNTRVVHFALNSLRQLSIRFLGIEELPGFKFQKDFLKPFEHIMNNTSVVQVKEIVLHSVIQMIQARGENIRSGWRTIFGVFTIAARERFESIVNLAYDNVIQIYNTRFGVVIAQGAFPDLAVCLTDFSKNARFQKKSLQAIETLKSTIPRMLKTPECPLSADAMAASKQISRQTQEEQFWFPILFAFHDVLMTGDDLEVRSRALNYLFDTLVKYGKDFPRDFWDTIWRQLLFPIFMVMKSKPEMNKMINHEELSVWLSTTMIQALRNMMSLFTHYFESLEYMLDRFLDLLGLCICQENDTLARIGSNCLQTLILQNVNKFKPEHWTKIVSAFVDLFTRTEATSLFSAVTAPYPQSHAPNGSAKTQVSRIDTQTSTESQSSERQTTPKRTSRRPTGSRSTSELSNGEASPSMGYSPLRGTSEVASPIQSQPSTPTLEDYRPETQLQQAPVVVTAARRRFFNQIITKCVLQLLLIETVNELFSNDDIYARIPSMELLRLMALLKKSYHFAKRFNSDLELRNRLFQEGFMKQPPNLLKQESGSASVYVNILFRMYQDEGEERKSKRDQTEAALIPLCVDIIEGYLQLSEETQQRNIITWRPVVIEVIEGYAGFHRESFEKHAGIFAPLATALMGREMGLELQRAVQGLVHRIFEIHYDIPVLELPTATPTSPRGGSRPLSRRQSRVGSK